MQQFLGKDLSVAEAKKIAKDNYLFREGDPADAMYIIKSGLLAVTKTKGQSEVSLAEISPGSMVGEMGLFDNKPRSANVKAIKETEVIALPYESLNKQLDQLPVWVRAILKNLNETIRESNKKLKQLETANADEERFPPHVINKLMSIFNFVCNKYGKPEANGVSISSVLLRNYTIQIFQEATNKMNSLVNALTELGFATQEDRGDGTQKIVNMKAAELFAFVDWHNDWIYKQEKDKKDPLTEQECKVLNALIHFAKKVEPDKKGLNKVSLTDLQNDSVKEFGQLIKPDDVNSLIEKKYLNEKIMDGSSVFVLLELPFVEPQANNWTLLNNLKRRLR
ncbi:Crp/Fnr family transcriptional regulator [Bdellovibrio sp. ZAP7]|uniref:Crp/Fnr family transcriptional regulator n=1 Tax=Bdellovibrio sp. ZAP7 TaxID=2231053 RepID=UPI001FF002E3|nr:cyclic nucleotide-binding domain-containing protein [Bdellovibrio sp. ZAP7]